jgi:hypothetical protein
MRLGRDAGPIIEHRVNQVLKREAIFRSVPRQQRHKAAARLPPALAHHADAA